MSSGPSPPPPLPRRRGSITLPSVKPSTAAWSSCRRLLSSAIGEGCGAVPRCHLDRPQHELCQLRTDTPFWTARDFYLNHYFDPPGKSAPNIFLPVEPAATIFYRSLSLHFFLKRIWSIKTRGSKTVIREEAYELRSPCELSLLTGPPLATKLCTDAPGTVQNGQPSVNHYNGSNFSPARPLAPIEPNACQKMFAVLNHLLRGVSSQFFFSKGSCR